MTIFSKLSALVISGSLSAAAIFSFSSGPSLNTLPSPVDDGDALADFGANELLIRRAARNLTRTEFEFVLAGGIEMGSAGIHAMYPEVDDDLGVMSGGFPHPGEHTVRNWGFWAADPRYSAPYSKWELYSGGIAENVNVTFLPIVANALFSYSLDVGGTAGSYSIVGDMNLSSLRAAKRLLAPDFVDPLSGEVTDWYGIKRSAGATESELRILLVADNEAYHPISLTEITHEALTMGLTSYSVTLADGLTLTEANQLLSRLAM